MKNYDTNEAKKESINSYDNMKIKTGSATYSFTQSWVENEALKDILVGLIAEDLNKQQFNG